MSTYNTPRRLAAPLLMAAATLAGPGRPAHAEGSAQLGDNGRVQTDTLLRLDILDPAVERIAWRGAGQLVVTSPDGATPVATLNTGESTGSLAAIGPGAYRLALGENQGAAGAAADWDVGVVDQNGAPLGGPSGRLFSAQWNIVTGDRGPLRILNTSFFARVPGGAPDSDAVVEVQFTGVNGNFHRIGMNGTGIDGRHDGRSGPENSGYTPEYPLYLRTPAIRAGGTVDPTLGAFEFRGSGELGGGLPVGGDPACGSAVGSGGGFAFETNAAGRYRVVCDTSGDGRADLTDANDLLLVGNTTPGVNFVPWNGLDNTGATVVAGDYTCEVLVGVGELHFLGQDIETSYPGIRMYETLPAGPRPLAMYWDDSLCPDPDVPMPDGQIGLPASGPDGIFSNGHDEAPVPNVSARSWGDFADDGKRGGNEVSDTYTFARIAGRARLTLHVVDPAGDADADGLSDVFERCGLGTDPTDADTDDDGVPDGEEIDAGGDTDGDGLVNALDPDSDNDGLFDGTERGVTVPGPDTDRAAGHFIPDADPATTTDPLDADTDDGTVPDGTEDTNHNGRVDAGERDPNLAADDLLVPPPVDADSDDDGLTDVEEAALGTDPLDPDSDHDGLFDGTERGVTEPGPDTDPAAGHFIPDADQATTTNPLDADTDDGTVPDGTEDSDHNGRVDPGERDPNLAADDVAVPPPDDTDGDGLTDDQEVRLGLDPLDADTDDDGVPDGAETSPGEDADGDGLANANDPDSDNDGILDGTELGVTLPGPGTDPAAGDFIPDADPTTTTDPLDPDTDDGSVPDGEEDANHNGRVDAGERDPNVAADDVAEPPPPPVDSDGDGLTDDREVELSLDPHDADTDDDGVIDGAEPAADVDSDGDGAIDAADPDSDNDGILDGTELGVTEAGPDTDPAAGHFVPDADPSTTTNPLDADTDDGSVSDGDEDTNHNGRVDAGERDPNVAADDVTEPPPPDLDSDDDGLTDTDEAALGTDPRDADSDDDGLLDGEETSPGADSDNDGLIDALDPDSDNDGVGDGTEAGVTEPGPDTDPAAGHFTPDADPSTTTDPLDADTDDGGVKDGVEDPNGNGRVDEGERDPNDPADDVAGSRDSDGDGIPDDVETKWGLDPNDDDSDNDGISDGDEWGRVGGDPRDTDGDGTPDVLDLDSDNDTILDSDEAGDDKLGTPPIDSDGDGTPDYLDLDTDNDGRPDTEEAGDADLDTPPVDTDEDDLGDWRDLDSDGDGLTDTDDLCPLEAAATADGCLTGDKAFKLAGAGACSTMGPGSGGTGRGLGAGLALLLAAGLRRRRRAVRNAAAGLAAATLLSPTPSLAGDGFQLQRLTPAPGGDESIVQTQGPRVAKPYTLNAGLYLHYAFRELRAEGAINDDVVRHHLQADALAEITLFSRLSLGLAVPVTLYMGKGDAAGPLGGKFGGLSTAGLGDLRLVPKLSLFQGENVALALAAPVSLPTGDQASLQGGAGPTFEPKLLAGYRSQRLRLTANAGYRIQGQQSEANLDVGNEFTYAVGAGITPQTIGGGNVELLGELFGATAADPDSTVSETTLPFEGLAGVRVTVAREHGLTAMAGTGFTDGFGTPRFRALLGYTYTPAEPISAPPPPPADTDKDGILDVVDKCPNDPEDKDNFEDADGCPDPDNDKDGILDVSDKCPNDPEVVNGIEDTDGCPDQGASKVRLTNDHIEILDIVHFDTNKATIQKISFDLLNQVAAVLKNHPELRKIRVEGHTDSQGADKFNLRLSQARAEAVRDFLAHAGVDAARLDPKGYGENKPVESNATAEGRAKNRRVEFVIVPE